jgi:hypothetical protein
LADEKLSNRLLIWFPETKLINNNTFWGVTLCSLVDVHRCWGGTHCLHVEGQRVSKKWVCFLLATGFAYSLILKMWTSIRLNGFTFQKTVFFKNFHH